MAAPRVPIAPEVAWRSYIRPALGSQRWLEDSSHISAQIPLSKRELLALIVLAHVSSDASRSWLVGYHAADPEPNDGYISDGSTVQFVENKLIPKMAEDEVIEAVKSTYDKYAAKGAGYGRNRTMVIYANKASQGLAKVSALREHIGHTSPFDRVLLMYCVALDPGKVVVHVLESYPGRSLSRVTLDAVTGAASVRPIL